MPHPQPAVYVHTSDPVQLNSYLVVGARRAVVIDTGAGPAQATAILTAVRRLTDLPLTVVNTHDHWDHFFGNATFAAAGVDDFRASPAFVRDSAGSAWVQLEQVPLDAEPDLPPPGELLVDVAPVSTGDVLDLGGARVTFVEATGHSETDLIVLCDDIAFTGDLVEEGAPPQFGDDSLPARWADALEDLLARPEIAVFAPGHGAPVDRAFVSLQRGDVAGVSAGESGESDAHAAEAPVRHATRPFPWVPGEHPPGVRRLR